MDGLDGLQAQLATMKLRSGKVLTTEVVKTSVGKSKTEEASTAKHPIGHCFQPARPPTLQLGPNGKLVYLEDASKWVASHRRCSHVSMGSCDSCLSVREPTPTTLRLEAIGALQQLCETLKGDHYPIGVYKVENSLSEEAYQMEARTNVDVEEVYMFHGAPFAAIANIAEEGFDLAACNRNSSYGDGVFVSNQGWYSLNYCMMGDHAVTAVVHERVIARAKQLQEEHDSRKNGKLPAIPLLAEPPTSTRAMFVCKVLVPKGTKGRYTTASKIMQQEMNYSTTVTARVCPLLMVHLSYLSPEELVAYKQGQASKPVQDGRLP